MKFRSHRGCVYYTPENCARVKRYARLAIGNVNNAYDVKEALGFDPDVIEV